LRYGKKGTDVHPETTKLAMRLHLAPALPRVHTKNFADALLLLIISTAKEFQENRDIKNEG